MDKQGNSTNENAYHPASEGIENVHERLRAIRAEGWGSVSMGAVLVDTLLREYDEATKPKQAEPEEFKVGDRVEYVGNTKGLVQTEELIGMRGVVVAVRDSHETVDLHLDHGGPMNGCCQWNLRRIKDEPKQKDVPLSEFAYVARNLAFLSALFGPRYHDGGFVDPDKIAKQQDDAVAFPLHVEPGQTAEYVLGNGGVSIRNGVDSLHYGERRKFFEFCESGKEHGPRIRMSFTSDAAIAKVIEHLSHLLQTEVR